MSTTDQTSSFKSVLFDLSRIGEWWLLSLGLILFAFIPHIYQIDNRITIQNMTQLVTSPPLYVALVVVFSAQIFLFASNDYFDRHIDGLDEQKKRRNPVCTGKVTSKQVYVVLFATAVVSTAASLFFGLSAFLFTIFSLFVFYFYTAEPLRFKNKIGIDILSHGILINTFPYFFCLIALSHFTSGSLFLLMVLILRSTMAQLLQQVRDYTTDKKVEKNTTVVLGQKNAIWLVFMMYLTIFSTTSILLVTYQLYHVGLSLFYVVILFLCIAYIPIFFKLLTLPDTKEFIDRLWMGQKRTSRGISLRYAGSFGIYFFVLCFIII